MATVELSERQTYFVMRIIREGLLYMRTLLATPLFAGYGIVLVLVGVTLTSVFAGSTSGDIIPLSWQNIFPADFDPDVDNLWYAWFIISLALHLLQKLILLTTGVEIKFGYLRKVKWYFGSLVVLMLIVIIASLLRVGWLYNANLEMSLFLLGMAVIGLVSLAVSWSIVAYLDLFIFAIGEGIRQNENPDAPITHYAWPFKRHGMLEKFVLRRVGMTAEDYDEAEKRQAERFRRLEEINGRKIDSEEKEL